MFFSLWFRRLFFCEISPIIKIGRERIVAPEDLPSLPQELDAGHLDGRPFSPRLEGAWPLLGSLLRHVSKRTLVLVGLNLTRAALALSLPLVIRELIRTVSHAERGWVLGLCLALAVGLLGAAQGLVQQHYFFFVLRTRQILEACLNLRIFRHALHLSLEEKTRTPTGDIVNHMGTDTEGATAVPAIVTDFVHLMALAVGGTVLLFHILGPAALAAPAVLLLASPLTRRMGRRFVKLDEDVMKASDERNSRMAQVLNGIRVVKYFHWTASVQNEIANVRNEELGARRRLVVLRSFSDLVYLVISVSLCLVSFWIYVSLGNVLDAATVFSALAVMVVLEEPFGEITYFIAWVAGAKVGAERIAKFLRQDVAGGLEEPSGDAPCDVHIDDVTLGYQGRPDAVLSGVALTIEAGTSCAIVGPVGCGKSTLLLSIMNEISPRSGRVRFLRQGAEVRPDVAYVPQEAFIINGTVRENIVFGRDVSEEALAHAIEVAAFEADLKGMGAGLASEIGERGLNLSGGQKQRLSLARAAAGNPQVVLLDDPLSAVDPSTEKALLSGLVFGKWRGVTRLVATHKLSELERYDKVVFLQNGGVAAHGSFAELMEASVEFREFYSHALDEMKAGASHSQGKDGAVEPQGGGEQLTALEDREEGAVRAGVYGEYLKALGGKRHGAWVLMLMVVSIVAVNLFPILQRSWMAWASDGNRMPGFMGELFSGSKGMVLGYAILSLGFFLVRFGDHLFWGMRALIAGRDLHEQALQGVLMSPLRFFDTNPAGRIMNRFSRDLDSVDGEIGWSFGQFAYLVVNVCVTLVSTLLVVPGLVALVLPVMALYWVLQRDYRAVAREVKRLDSVARSPRFAFFKETVSGLPVVRSFRRESVFMEQFRKRLTESQRISNGSYMVNRWFSSRMPVLGGVVSAGVAVAVVAGAHGGTISAGTAGLVLSWALAVEAALNWSVRAFSELESRMTSVERLRSYAALAPEPEVVGEAASVDLSQWPRRGEIEFRDVYAKYANDLPYVLRGVSFKVDGGTRVGIVGRTGSGKSTLFQTLFRFIQVSRGEIRIDGVDIAKVPLSVLRRAVAVIPQDPVLFAGSLRENLDRFGAYTDGEIWEALSKAHLKDAIESLPGGLLAPVTENGFNFSQGQRQLICLARALLLKARIIVMDEPTASVDMRTDALIQRTIREECQGVTILVIAHRLNTVADCDKIVDMNLCYAS